MAAGPSQLRVALDATLAALPPRLLAAGEGDATCRSLCDLYDRELATRFMLATARAGVRAPLALVATGGWARRELAPYSDLDLILLHDGDAAAARRVCDELLYPLWDDKLAIGHAVRTPAAAAQLAVGDLATATALLDARHVAGARSLTTELVRATLAAVADVDLIARLAEEQRARHARFGASLYLLEPNVKQGSGGLRDLATALWAAAIRWLPPRADREPVSARGLLSRLVADGHLSARQAHVLGGARDFLLRVRALVQLGARRRVDQLTFELQEAIAPRLYPGAMADGRPRAVAPAVESLMQQYYLHARGVLQVTEQLLAAAARPARAPAVRARIDDTFDRVDGELVARDADVFAARPSAMLSAFRVAVAHAIPVAAGTRARIADAVARDPAALAADPEAMPLLAAAICDPADAAQPSALEALHELGVVGALLPEWAPCTARVQHDLYHVFTVDQHQLYALAMQKQLARGELGDEHPLATALWREVAAPRALFLATLLHDVGKPHGAGHAERGAEIASAVAARLGMSAAEAALCARLVRQHLTMSHVSQRRDLSDADVITRFAARVGADALAPLYLLTVCDTAMTAPGNLTAWKAELLSELFTRARAGEAAPVAHADADVAVIDPRLLAQLTPPQAGRARALLDVAAGKRPPLALDVRPVPATGHSELLVVAPDAPGCLAAIAGALAAHRVDVLGAALGGAELTGGRRVACDLFFIRDGKGAAIAADDARWARLGEDLRALLADAAGPAAVTALIARRRPASGLPKRITPGVPTAIRWFDDSAHSTLVEIVTRDRPGVLHAITRALAEAGLDISRAQIATEGERVADVFTVTRQGDRLAATAERDAIDARLLAALAEVP